MWAIRLLSGPQAGKVIPLKSGANVLGRAPSCDIKILSPNVSKEHTKIDVLDGKFIVSDMGSRNGTFVNGTQVRSTRVKEGDQIGLFDVVLEIVPFSSAQAQAQAQSRARAQAQPRAPNSPPPSYGNLAYQMNPAQDPETFESPADGPRRREGLQTIVSEYMDRVVLPGVYHLAEVVEFKWLLGIFMGVFILLVTSLSTIPLIRILRDSVEEQSQQHALTIAATLAKVNEGAIREGLYTAINMQTAQRSGVSEAMIVTAMDGKILAPSSRAESFSDIPFVHEARKMGREAVRQINGTTVVALYPIAAYNPETGSRGVLAYSVVVYDMTTLAVDDGKTISLFVITLFIATLLGGLLFFFVYKLIEYPLMSLNLQLDSALREGRDNLKVTFLFPALSKLAGNINSALSRTAAGGSEVISSAIEYDRRLEMENLAEMTGFPSMVISAHDRVIATVNAAFEERTRLSKAQLLNQNVAAITDQALKLSLQDLMDRLQSNPDQLATNDLEFGGQGYQLIAQAIYGSAKIAYFMVILVPSGGGQ